MIDYRIDRGSGVPAYVQIVEQTERALVLCLMHRFGQSLLLWLLLGFAWAYELTVLELRVADHATVPPGESRPSWAVCAAVLTVCLGLLALAGVQGPLARLRWRPLVTAGGLTYPFYLVHQSIGIPLANGLIRAFPKLGPLPSMEVSVVCAGAAPARPHRGGAPARAPAEASPDARRAGAGRGREAGPDPRQVTPQLPARKVPIPVTTRRRRILVAAVTVAGALAVALTLALTVTTYAHTSPRAARDKATGTVRPGIIEALEARGCTIVTVSQLLAPAEPQPGMVYRP